MGFYVLAPGVRLVGPTAGVLLSTALVTGASVLVAAWVVFRQAGPRAERSWPSSWPSRMWTAGGAGLVDPLSSNLGRFPLLAAAVLLWALACGDLRLAPLAVVTWSFAVQQHLSVLPAAVVLAGAGALVVVAAVVGARRSGAGVRGAARWVGGALGAGLVVWSPVLVQELRGDPGNLSRLADYRGDPARVALGPASGIGQVLRVLGLPPFVGRSGVEGWDLIEPPTPAGIGVALVLVVVLVAGAWWARRREPRLTALIAVVGALAVAGVLTGANLPDSPEKGRLNLFHWAFALSALEVLALTWVVVAVVSWRRARGAAAEDRSGAAPARPALLGPVPAAVAGLVTCLVLALLPLGRDRTTDRLATPIRPAVVDEVVEAIEDEGLHEGPVLALVEGEDAFTQVADTVRVRLVASGMDVRFGPDSDGFVAPEHMLDPCRADQALVVGVGAGREPEGIPGRRVARVEVVPELDDAAVGRLADEADGQEVVLGPDLQGALDDLPGDLGALRGSLLAFRLGSDTEAVVRNRDNVDLLLAHPPASPELDRDDLLALRESFPEGVVSVPITHISVHRLDRAELRALRPDLTEGCA